MKRIDELRRAQAEAEECLAVALPRRWAHVQTVGHVAEELVECGDVAPAVAIAAWLHDVGYGPAVRATGFHPLDGAHYLRSRGWSSDVVNLVAHHTGAPYEAEERGLAEELGDFPVPDVAALDALCLADLTTGPDGSRVTVDARISEILGRYSPTDPVHRAITRAEAYLREAAARAATASSSTNEWVRAALV